MAARPREPQRHVRRWPAGHRSARPRQGHGPARVDRVRRRLQPRAAKARRDLAERRVRQARRNQRGDARALRDARARGADGLRRCSSTARRAPARSSSRARSTMRHRAPRSRSSSSTARRCRRTCSTPSSSATRAAPSPARMRRAPAPSSPRRAARSSSTRVGELPISMQPKLLRVLESRTVRRVGETAHRNVDVRFLSATHRDLLTMVNAGGVPRGPVLPPLRPSAARAGAARSQGGHQPAREPLLALCGRPRAHPGRADARAHDAAVAGQRPRAQEFRRARAGARRHRGARDDVDVRARSASVDERSSAGGSRRSSRRRRRCRRCHRRQPPATSTRTTGESSSKPTRTSARAGSTPARRNTSGGCCSGTIATSRPRRARPRWIARTSTGSSASTSW